MSVGRTGDNQQALSIVRVDALGDTVPLQRIAMYCEPLFWSTYLLVFTSSDFQASTTWAGNRRFFWSSHGAQATYRWAQVLMTARRSLVMWVVDGCTTAKTFTKSWASPKQSAPPLQSMLLMGLERHTEHADQEETHRQIAPLPFPPQSSKWCSPSFCWIQCCHVLPICRVGCWPRSYERSTWGLAVQKN